MSFLKEDPDWVITFRGEGYHLGVRNSDETSGGNPWNSMACTMLGVTTVTWYIHSRVVLFLEFLLLIQSPARVVLFPEFLLLIQSPARVVLFSEFLLLI